MQKKKSIIKTETFGNPELDAHEQWLRDKLARAIELKENAEKSLKFFMDKFEYAFDFKKEIIKEIEARQEEIKELKIILKI